MSASSSTPVHRVTRRSAFLILFGIGYMVIGWSYVTGPPSPALHQQLGHILDVCPLWLFGAVWLLCGGAAVVTGAFRWHKPIGFGALTFIGIVWGIVYFIAWWPLGTSPTGYRTAVIFWVISAAVHIVAGMVDRDR